MFHQDLLDIREYLVSYGTMGEFGRFRPKRSLMCRRGESAVIQTHRGLELGTILCESRAGHALFLPNTSVGELVRRASDEDRQTARQHQTRAQALYQAGCRLVGELGLSLEVLDAELLLDGRQAVLHLLRSSPCDERPLVSTLCKEFDVFIALHYLGPQASADKEEEATCGAENCGQGHCDSHEGGGGCSTCAVATIFKGRQQG